MVLDSILLGLENIDVTKEDLIKRLKGLSKGRFAKVAPFIEADLDAADNLTALHKEIEAGRHSAATQPILDAKDVYTRVRQALSK
jgi:5,10-methylenetetrahydrofolate reductase